MGMRKVIRIRKRERARTKTERRDRARGKGDKGKEDERKREECVSVLFQFIRYMIIMLSRQVILLSFTSEMYVYVRCVCVYVCVVLKYHKV